ncbi:MAG: penicillin-binding protein 1C [Lentisphaerae bacterium]|nr:penicillin-binding protein 1C [Lentisphaerota bacterium]
MHRTRARAYFKRLMAGTGIILAMAGLAVWLCIPAYRDNTRRYPASVRILDRNGGELRLAPGTNVVFCTPIALSETGDWAVKALIAAEDKRFYRHAGIDWLAVLRALTLNAASLKTRSGASTLSTLVIKLTYPRPRTLWTKIIEAHHARQLERQMGKNAILEQYLNRAPFGGALQGIEAASLFYFGKPANALSLSEVALLIGLPQQPSRLRPDLHPDRALRRRNYVLSRMNACGFIGRREYAGAIAQPVAAAGRPRPFRAPHFCDFILKRYAESPAPATTLDPAIQALAEQTLDARLTILTNRNIHGAAVVILDVKTAALRAMVGSPDFQNAAAAGQVNGATARRSPGSALKPFIYGLALDQGLCSPQTVIADAPVNFSGYRPSNFDRDFHGRVSVRGALVNSLNIPALLYTQKVGLDRVAHVLRTLGLSTLDQPADHYGLSLAIGTCEVTLLDMANAYACLAREGVFTPLRCLEAEERGAETRVFSRETAFMLADMLSGDERLFETTGQAGDVVLPRVAWKTGTSSGYRDAWTLAYNPDFVVGVWLGNPRGQVSEMLIGTAAAGIAHAIFRRLYPEGNAPWYARPAGLQRRQVCALSGEASTAFCPITVVDDAIEGITVRTLCRIHRDAPGGLTSALSAPARRDSSASRRTDGPAADRSVCIVSPAPGATFRLMDALPSARQELKLEVQPHPTALYWFVDQELYRTADSRENVFWPLQEGRHRIVCCTAMGESDSVEITVE